MTHKVRVASLIASLVFLILLAVAGQAGAQSTPSPVAYVYVQIQGPDGAVYGFNASSAGHLSAIPGSPFKVTGTIIGATPTKFFTQGEDLLHSYSLSASGVIGSQLGQAPVFDYSGSGCGSAASGQNGAVLDHSGKYIYVLLQGGLGDCAAYQTYAINSDGSFSFAGDTEHFWAPLESGAGLPSILGNESFAYADHQAGSLEPTLSGFRRESSGTLELTPITVTLPTPLTGGSYTPVKPDASPKGNYVILQLYRDGSDTPQIGTFTVDEQGNLSTTNTFTNMQPARWPHPSSTFSPSGDFVVFYSGNGPNYQEGGTQAYRFTGASAVYPYLAPGSIPTDQMEWDNSNHVYGLSTERNLIWVWYLTTSSTYLDQTYSLPIQSPYKMVVVSK